MCSVARQFSCLPLEGVPTSNRLAFILHCHSLCVSCAPYLGPHVQEPASVASGNFRMQFTRMSSAKEYEHMLFAEASVSCCKVRNWSHDSCGTSSTCGSVNQIVL